MAIEMPKFSASRPASSTNGSRSRRVSHTANGPMIEPKGTMSPAKVDRWAATAVLRNAWSTVSVRVAWLAPHWGQIVACWSSLAEQAGHVLFMTPLLHLRSTVEAPCWYAIDDRPPGPVHRRPQSDTWLSAGKRSEGAAVIPQEECGSSQTVN